MCCGTDIREIPCRAPGCDGGYVEYGPATINYFDGSVSYHSRLCHFCNGTGNEEVPLLPICQADLDCIPTPTEAAQ